MDKVLYTVILIDALAILLAAPAGFVLHVLGQQEKISDHYQESLFLGLAFFFGVQVLLLGAGIFCTFVYLTIDKLVSVL